MDELSRKLGPWTVEWCCRGEQKGLFHIDTLKDHIKRNLRTYAGMHEAEHVSAWIIIGITETSAEAQQLATQMRELLKELTK
jgi:hypothetical protein